MPWKRVQDGRWRAERVTLIFQIFLAPSDEVHTLMPVAERWLSGLRHTPGKRA
jgi:hypothetical protein